VQKKIELERKMAKGFSQLPRFKVNPSFLKFLGGPSEFYDTLCTKAASANFRITLCSLYLGTDTLERSLIQGISDRLSKKGDIKATFLFDALRGTRGKDSSSLSMLHPLLTSFPNQVNVFMYRTHLSRGLKTIVPPRWNETLGVQHMKVYIFDDDIIISGANLSSSYFTNRMDRYLLVENSKELADFYHDLVSNVGEISLNYRDGVLQDPVSTKTHKVPDFIKTILMRFWMKELAKSSEGMGFGDMGFGTYIMPTIQLGSAGIRIDEDCILQLIKQRSSKLRMAAGYFNITEDLSKTLLNSSSSTEILISSPQANGFFEAKGVAKYIPSAYVVLEHEFYSQIKDHSSLRLFEYNRPEWTFHSKGINRKIF
jgi:CDP-diacylglycerol--glycerol-3-phosphate 3-phosphatidyltransferase